MKHAKTHTGTYSCLNCYVEYDLVGETHLKCDECGAPLTRGTLDELYEDEDGEEPTDSAI
jgi:PHP family Zn ribbon phosphoesterase